MATIDMGQKEGAAVPLSQRAGGTEILGVDNAGVDNNRGNCRGRLCRSGQTCLDAPLEVAMDMLMCVLNCIGYNW